MSGNDEISWILREQEHVDLIVLNIDQLRNGLERRLAHIQLEQERRILRRQDSDYAAARPNPFYAVFEHTNDLTGFGELFRIGRASIHDGQSNVLVCNWDTPEANRYVELERDFGNTVFQALVKIEDGKVISIADTNSKRAERRRQRILETKGETLTDIIEVIRPEQNDIVREETLGGLVISGGPGTGKTVVGLQRLAFLLRERGNRTILERPVLIIGPSKTYVDYVRDFLPNLGHTNFVSIAISELCLRRVDDGRLDTGDGFRDDRDSVTILKNSAGIIQLIRSAIWDKTEQFEIHVEFNYELGVNRSLVISRQNIDDLLVEIYKKFLSGSLSYEGARSELKGQIASKITRAGDTRENVQVNPRTKEARRDSLMQTWLLKIGIHNQSERRKLLKALDKPSGRRFERGLFFIMNEYKQKDIEIAIDLISERATIEPSVLREALVSMGAERKERAGEQDENDGSEVEILEVGDFSQFDLSQLQSSGSNSKVDKLIDRILPVRAAVDLGAKICSGDKQFFRKSLDSKWASLGKRLANDAEFDRRKNGYLWTNEDLPILAELDFLIRGNESADRFSQVLIDEAQDMTRMQARVISRFINSDQVVVIGDENQATRPSSLGRWKQVMDELDVESWAERKLEINYRVPENIYDYARGYLTENDRIDTPTCENEGGDVVLIDVSPRQTAEYLIDTLDEKVRSGERVGVLVEALEKFGKIDLSQYKNIVVVSPENSKGLEFDHVIFIQPGDWYQETQRMRKLMYVSLTRATKSVTILQNNPEKNYITTPINLSA